MSNEKDDKEQETVSGADKDHSLPEQETVSVTDKAHSLPEQETVSGTDKIHSLPEQETVSVTDKAHSLPEQETVSGTDKVHSLPEQETVSGTDKAHTLPEQETVSGADKVHSLPEQETVSGTDKAHSLPEQETVSGTDKVHSLPDRRYDFSDLDKGWAWVVLFASFGTFFLIGNSMYAVGIIHSSLLDRYGEKVTLTSWAGAFHTAMMSLGAPLSTAVIDRYSCRTAITFSGVFFVVGYLGTAFAETIELAIFTCGILAGTGAALGYTAAVVVVEFNFRRRRRIALGIAVSGMGAGLFVLAPLMQFAREYYGPVGFFIILAAMTANIITFGQLCFPSKLELHTQMRRKLDATRSSESQNCFAPLKPYLSIVTNKAMVCLSLCMFLFCLGTYSIFLHLPTFIVTKGFSAVQASLLVSLTGIMSMIGRLLTGVVANLNRINDTILYSGSMCIVGIVSFIYPFTAEYFAGHVIFAVLFGLFFGTCYVTITSVSLKFVGISYVAAAIGLQFGCGGIGAVAGPVCAGAVVDAGGTYEQSLIVAAVIIVLAALSSGVTMCFRELKGDEVLHMQAIEISVVQQNNSETSHEDHRSGVTECVQNGNEIDRQSVGGNTVKF